MADMHPLMSSLLHLQRRGTRNRRLFVLPSSLRDNLLGDWRESPGFFRTTQQGQRCL